MTEPLAPQAPEGWELVQGQDLTDPVPVTSVLVQRGPWAIRYDPALGAARVFLRKAPVYSCAHLDDAVRWVQGVVTEIVHAQGAP